MSPTHLLRRLLTMDRREIWFRASTASRREAARVAYLARRPQWRRAGSRRRARADHPSIAAGDRLRCDEGDWLGAHQALMHHFATRPPRFVLDPAARSARARDDPRTLSRRRRRRGPRVAIAWPPASSISSAIAGLTFGDGGHPERIDWHFDPVHQRHAPQTVLEPCPLSRSLAAATTRSSGS